MKKNCVTKIVLGLLGGLTIIILSFYFFRIGSWAQEPCNPVHIHSDEGGISDYTVYDYVCFGEYPQDEIFDTEVIADIDAAIGAGGEQTIWDVTVGTSKYRRVDTSAIPGYNSSVITKTYRYFQWSKIKWRVLYSYNDGEKLCLMADSAIDWQEYDSNASSMFNGGVTWDKSTIRSWLNSYSSDQNSVEKDYSEGGFANMAFTSAEKNALCSTDHGDNSNPKYNTNGGSKVYDRVSLLTIKEATVLNWGFCPNLSKTSASRMLTASDYAYAMCSFPESEGEVIWWLSSPGMNQYWAAAVRGNGGLSTLGFENFNVTSSVKHGAVVPIITLDTNNKSLFAVEHTVVDCGSYGTNIDWELTTKANGKLKLSIAGTGDMDDLSSDNLPSYFDYSSQIDEVVIGEGITGIGACCFWYMNAIESISFPSTLTEIGSMAFMKCNALTSLTIPGNVKSIQNMAFANCAMLKSVVLEAGVEEIAAGAFERCSVLASVSLPATLKNISNEVFIYAFGLKQIIIPDSVVSLGDRIFKGCTALNSITLSHKFIDNDLGVAASDTLTVKYTGLCDCNKLKSNKYIKSAGSCIEPAEYYYEGEKCHGKCSESYVSDVIIGHSPEVSTNPAGIKNDGSIVKQCSVCHEVIDTTIIPRAYVSVDDTAKYTGKAIKQPVKVTDVTGKSISKSFYSVTYKNNKNSGKATVTIKFSGNYTGSVTKNFTIVKKELIPAKVSGLKLTAGKKSFTVSWKEGTENADGYEIQYSTDKNFLSGVKTVKISNSSTVSKTISKLKAKTSYYVRVRSYNKEGKTIAYSAWNTVKKAVKTK